MTNEPTGDPSPASLWTLSAAVKEIERLRGWLMVISRDTSRGGQQTVYALSGAPVPDYEAAKPVENDLMSGEPSLLRWKGMRCVAVHCDYASHPFPTWTYQLQCVDGGRVHDLPPSPTMMPEGVEVIGPLHAQRNAP